MFAFTKVLPTIVPFSFGEEEINLDETVLAACAVSKGDLPLSIFWRFTEEGTNFTYNLTTNDGLMINRNGQKVSTLIIDVVKARHRGNYTCVVSNKGGIVQHSAYLKMNGRVSLIYQDSC